MLVELGVDGRVVMLAGDGPIHWNHMYQHYEPIQLWCSGLVFRANDFMGTLTFLRIL